MHKPESCVNKKSDLVQMREILTNSILIIVQYKWVHNLEQDLSHWCVSERASSYHHYYDFIVNEICILCDRYGEE
jgi:hypothetical protein